MNNIPVTAIQAVPYQTLTGRSGSPTLSTMPVRCRNPEEKIAFDALHRYAFPEDSEWTFIFFDFAS